MTLDSLLALGQNAQYLVDAPWGPVISRISGTLRASLPRIEKDNKPIIDFLDELMPVIIKHWPAVGPAVNDYLPIVQQLIKDAKT